MSKKVVETKLAKLAVETRLVRFAVDTRLIRFAVDTKLAKLVVETTPVMLETYPEVGIPQRVYNWSPKDWRWSSGPSYNFKDQTGAVDPDLLKWYLEGGQVKRRSGKIRLPSVRSIDGDFKPGSDPANHILVESLSEHVTRKHINNK